MMKIAISAESTVDLPKELLEKYDIHTLPFTLIMGEKQGLDGEIQPEDLFAFTDKTGELAKTSAVNEYQFEEHFRKIKEEGYDAIIHFSLSSEISAAYSNGVAASKKFENVYVVDSRVLSTGIALECIYARRLAEAGNDPQTIVSKVKERIPYDQSSFSLESVNYLYKGGRCSAVAMIGANLLKLKPEIIVQNGKMIAGKKYRGSMMVAVMGYVNDILEEFHHPDKELVFITYSTAPQDVLDAVRARLEKEGFRNIVETRAGGTISCHCGPHCLGILYFNDGEHPIA